MDGFYSEKNRRMEKRNFSLNKNYEGDCVKIMPQLDASSINLILTDPPYNASKGGVDLPENQTGGAYFKVNEDWDIFEDYKDYFEFTKKWIKEADRVLSNEGSIMVCCSFHNIGEVIMSLKELDYKFLNLIIWEKPNAMPSITKRMLTYSTEFIVWFSKGKRWTYNYEEMKKYNFGKQLRDVWRFPSCQGSERIRGNNGRAAHPTQKPIKLFERLVEMASKKGEVVLDPFIGSGTTALACEKLQRKWIGIDKNAGYIKIADGRLKEYNKQKKLSC
jgi:site-specific DNA-methyltransferase (adenine-specific)/modification methylase